MNEKRRSFDFQDAVGHAVFIACFVMAGCLYAQAPQTATVEGRVYNAQTGDPVRKAQILVRHWAGRRGQGAYAATTDAAGRYRSTASNRASTASSPGGTDSPPATTDRSARRPAAHR